MKHCRGVVWKYRNSPARGITWAAELTTGNSLLCAYGQKHLKSAISIANKMAKTLNWKRVGHWHGKKV